MDLQNKRVLITGGHGFLGKYVVEQFLHSGANTVAPRRQDYDLLNKRKVQRILEDSSPDVVVHLAASLGGIAANEANPGKFFYENIMMSAQLMHESMLYGVEKFVQVGTSCSYPASAPTPVKETDLWTGYPNKVTGPYGVAKLAMITMAEAYRTQYGLNAITLIPVNLYGPRDSFDPFRSHVIPALIMKCLDAKKHKKDLIVWGTGNATREFLYVEEAAKAIVMATERYDKPEPVNLGSGTEVFIKQVAEMVAKATGFEGNIVWDSSKPDGQLRRCFDVTKAREEFGFQAEMPMEEGIKRTVEWYESTLSHN